MKHPPGTPAAETLYARGVELDKAGHSADAIDAFRRAREADPRFEPATRALAAILLEFGARDEARDIYATLIDRRPLDVDAHYAYSKLTRYAHGDPTLAALEALTAQAGQLDPTAAIKLAFTIGKANHDLERYDDAWVAFGAGNALHWRGAPYDEQGNYAMLADAQRCFDAAFVRHQPAQRPGPQAIFILGMPRSGSTLLEQMLSSHPNITSAGEIGDLQQVVQTHLIGARATFSRAKPQWTEDTFGAAAEDYMSRLAAHGPDARFVIDKLPGNFALAGLIAAMLPGARIIHSSRHPVATLWSNYSTLFARGLNFTYSLDVLTRYIARYRTLMQHWHDVVPAAQLTRLEYETLVGEPEATLHPLVNWLGLPWESACLRYHESDRRIRTASVGQAHRPVYRDALARWMPYRTHLAPWIDQLGES